MSGFALPEEILEARRRLDPAPSLIPLSYGRAEEMLPFRAREAASLPPAEAAGRLVDLVLEGVLSPLEYVHSALIISSSFSLDPRHIIGGVEVGEALSVRVTASPMRPSRATIRRFILMVDRLARALGAEWTPDGDYADDLSREVLLSCGGVDQEGLEGLLRILRFRLEPGGGGRPLAWFLCRAASPRRDPGVRALLPGRSFRVECVDVGIEGAVAFSEDLPRAVGYLLGSGDLVELVAGAVARRRALLLKDLPGPEAGPEGLRSLGVLALDCSDPFLGRAREGLRAVRVLPGSYAVNPSTGSHVLFPAVEDEPVELNARACPICGTVTYSVRCPSCGSLTEPTRVCPSCRAATKSEVCERCGVPTVRTRRFRISFSREMSRLRAAGEVRGEEDFPGGAYEDPLKGVLRARHGLRVCCDGTTRASAVLLRYRGLRGCSLVLPYRSARVLLEVSRFVDEVASRAFSADPPYRLSGYRDLVGREVLVLPRGGGVGYLAKVVGLAESQVGFSGPSLPQGPVSLLLPHDLAWNASYELAEARAGACEWGVPTAIVGCEEEGGEAPQGLTWVDSGLPSEGGFANLLAVLERNLPVLAQLRTRELCPEIRDMLEGLARLYSSPEVVCESCGRRLRRPTASGECPYCGGRLRPVLEAPDAEALRALADAAEGLCGPLASLTLDRLSSGERQSRLTDFL